MNELALCAGVGGISLGLRRSGFRTVCYVERNPYRVQVLKSRIADGDLDDAPIWDDVTTFNGRPWRGHVDLISAGFPCQPFSLAGNRQGADDERYLWPDIYHIICETRPSYILLENVPGLLSMDRGRVFGTILADLARFRYDTEWQILPASAFGAPHKRERVFIIAYPDQGRWQTILCPFSSSSKKTYEGWPSSYMDTPGDYIQAVEECICEPAIFGSNDGTAYRVERLEAIGESVVPQIAEYIGNCIMEREASINSLTA